MMLRRIVLAAAAALIALPAAAQAPTAAERAELMQRLQVLDAELQAIRSRLGGGGSADGPTVTADVLGRLAAFETELRRLTANLEAVEFAQRQAIADAEARYRFLDDRLALLEGGDLAAAAPSTGAPTAPPAGAPTPPAAAPAPPTLGAPPQPLGALTVEVPRAERAAFDSAREQLTLQGVRGGEGPMTEFLLDHPGSALAGEAWLALGEAYASAGQHREAARSHLAGVRDHGGSPAAPANLVGLAEALTALGRMGEACSAYGEFATRFPAAEPPLQARVREGRGRAGC